MKDFDSVLICGHGSRDKVASDSFFDLMGRLKKRLAPMTVEGGFLEFQAPNIREVIALLKSKNKTNIRAVPLMLTAAGHVKNDIPCLLAEEAEKHNVKITMASDLGLDPKIINAANDKIKDALGENIKPEESMLLVVGRGTSDPAANAEICRLTRFLWEGHGFAWAETAYSGVAYPLVAQSLDKIVALLEPLGIKNLIVYPHFIFDGILIQRIYDACDKLSLARKDINLVKVQFLGEHPLLLDCLLDRVNDSPVDDNMNCFLCKYRVRLPGHEHSHGEAQASHHHHSEHGHHHDH